MIYRLLRRIDVYRCIVPALLAVVLWCIAQGLGGIIHGADVELLSPVALCAMLVAWWLAASHLSGWLAGSLLAVGGAAALFLRNGRLDNLFGKFLSTLPVLFWQVATWIWNGRPDTAPARAAFQNLVDGFSIVATRVSSWVEKFFAGKSAFDPISVALFWSLVMWLAAGWAAWAVRRFRQPFLGILPGAVILALMLDFAGGSSLILVLLLAASLLLIASLRYISKEESWARRGIDFAEELRLDMILTAVLIVVGVATAAYFMPSLTPNAVRRFFDPLRNNALAVSDSATESLGVMPKQKYPLNAQNWQTSGLPREHLLGNNPNLPKEVALIVRTHDLSPMPEQALSITNPPPQYYWRAMTYDRYTGHGWTSGQSEIVEYQSNQPTIPLNPASYRIVEHDIIKKDPQDGLLYVAGLLKSVDQPYMVAWRYRPGIDVDQWFGLSDIMGATTSSTVYHVVSAIPQFTPAQLQAASDEYPDWIQQHYLELPKTVPRRVINLALDLTATAPTQYDRTVAIETYLGQNYAYTLDLPLPPVSPDLVDYFLFDLKKGYCDYYASAMVVLARAAGIPARLVMGYASSSYDALNAQYIITQADAHTWVEVYFPKMGWVEFEPTAGRVWYASGPPSQPTPEPTLTAQRTVTSLSRWTTNARTHWQDWLLVAGFILLLVLSAGLMIGARRFRHMKPSATIIHLYHKLYRAARRLLNAPQVGYTPHEFAAALQGQFERWSARRSMLLLLPAGREIRLLTELYTQSVYSHHPPDEASRLQALELWKRLRWRLLVARVLKHFV